MASVTLSPEPYLTVLDANGLPVSGAKITTYVAGTTTLQATYTDATGTVANANPIVADSSGRYVAYLLAGASYKYVITTSVGVAIRTQDGINAVPASAANLDVTGTAGEALTAGQAVYLSDGSGSKTAGQWYKADSANSYSSSAAVSVGMVPASILSAATGTIRLAGSMSGLSALTLGSTYYVATAGALTATQPTNARVMGIADSTSTLVLAANPGTPNQDNGINDFRLTLTTGTPVTAADVTAATTIYCTPYRGNRVALFDAAGNATVRTSAEFSIAVPATTSQMYDVFCYSNSGVPTLELLAWTNDTTRATAIVLTTTGTYTKSADLTRRYLGSFRTTTVSGQTEDSAAKRYVWNNYNRVKRLLQVNEATDSWAYTLATMRQANASTANQLDVVVGVADVLLDVNVIAHSNNSGGGVARVTAIGEDSTTTATGQVSQVADAAAVTMTFAHAHLSKYPAVGRHFYAWLEYSIASNTTTWYGDNGNAQLVQSGIYGAIDG